jgi:hypothetical protein
MSEASPVEEIKSRRREAEQASATFRQRAEEAANRLVISPTRELMAERDGLRSEVELLTLQVEKLRQELKAAEVEQHRIALQEITAEQTADMAANDVWPEIEGGERQILAALDRHDALMNRSRARTRKAREHHFDGGFGDDTNMPTYSPVLPSPVKLIERLGKLPGRLRVAAGLARRGT